ncbi:MAG: hypothetical protein U1G07_13325 [Verrucomicrobiota bacterium]
MRKGRKQAVAARSFSRDFDTLAVGPPPGGPFIVSGTMPFVSAEGSSAIQGDVNGWVVIDPPNPAFAHLHDNGVITGGTGKTRNRGSRHWEHS